MFSSLLFKINTIKSTNNAVAELTSDKLKEINANNKLKVIPIETEQRVEISIANSESFPRFYPAEMALCIKPTTEDNFDDKLILSNSIVFSNYFTDDDNDNYKLGLKMFKLMFADYLLKNSYNRHFGPSLDDFINAGVILEEDKGLFEESESDEDEESESDEDEESESDEDEDDFYAIAYNKCKAKGLLSEINGIDSKSEYDKENLDQVRSFKRRLIRYLLFYPSISFNYNDLISEFYFNDDTKYHLKPESHFYIAFRLRFFDPKEITGEETTEDEISEEEGKTDGEYIFVRTNWLQVSSDGKSIIEVKPSIPKVEETTKKQSSSSIGIWIKFGIFVIITIIVILIGLMIYKKTTNRPVVLHFQN